MTPSHARKGGIKYRYYLSSPLLHAQPGRVGSVRRLAAAEVEALVQCAVREHLGDHAESGGRDLIRNHVVRVEVHADQLAVELKAEEAPSDPPNAVDHDRLVLRVPWKKTPMKRRRDIIVPASVSPHDRRPIRAETRATLVASIARGRRRLDEMVAGTVTGVEQIAARDKCSIRQVNMTISLAFLAPDLVKAAVEGRLPRGIGVTRLRDAPAEWSRQYAMLGLSIRSEERRVGKESRARNGFAGPRDATLVASIARGRRWLDEIVAGTVTGVEQIAARDKCSIRQVNMTISLAFLAPVLIKAAVEGRLPRGIGVTRLRDAPAEWSRQYAMLGLSI